MYKYHCLNNIAQVGLNGFTADYVATDNMDEAEAVLVRSAAMHDMEFSENILAIGRAGAGVNNIPLKKCAEKGIVVFNTPGANANSVKELVLGALFYASRDIIGGVNWVESERQNEDIAKLAEKQKKQYAGHEIKGKKLGVIGLGAIGVLVANAAANLGMDVLGYDPYISVDAAWSLSRAITHITDVNEIYRECDFITIHVPLLDSTKGMINAEAIEKMKDGVIVLNFARDLLVDEKAMVEALKTGKVGKYVSDFPNTTTVGVKNAIVTPHLGASTEEAEDNCAIMAVKELREYIERGNIKNSVNFPNCDLGATTPGWCRIAIPHRNVPNMLSQFTSAIAAEGINIENMTDKSRGEYAYTMFDLTQRAPERLIKRLELIDGVLKVRVIQ